MRAPGWLALALLGCHAPAGTNGTPGPVEAPQEAPATPGPPKTYGTTDGGTVCFPAPPNGVTAQEVGGGKYVCRVVDGHTSCAVIGATILVPDVFTIETFPGPGGFTFTIRRSTIYAGTPEAIRYYEEQQREPAP